MSSDSGRHLDLTAVAWALDAHGLEGVEDALRDIVLRARCAGLDPVVVDVLADRDAPEVARWRAFGVVAALLSRRPGDDRGPALQPAA